LELLKADKYSASTLNPSLIRLYTQDLTPMQSMGLLTFFGRTAAIHRRGELIRENPASLELLIDRKSF
jgi:hypothetical protein